MPVQATPSPAAQVAPATRPAWTADPVRIAEVEKSLPSFLFREEGVPTYTLPDALLTSAGQRVTTAADWERSRRTETLDLFAKYIYGRSPAAPAKITFDTLSTDANALDGKATLKRIRITSSDTAGKSFAFETSILTPNGTAGPVPAFLLINNRPTKSADPTRHDKADFWPAEEIVARGYATAVFHTADVDPDDAKPESRAAGVRGIWPHGGGTPDAGDEWATIAAWSWGASRVMDYLVTDTAIDPAKIAIIGHSRGGKTALWASAQDPRFALTIANESGEAGEAIARRRFGETTARINRNFPYWFAASFKAFDDKEDSLPVDQHQLLALIAPRPLYVASAGGDLWSDPKGEFLSLAAASEVYALYAQPRILSTELPPIDAPLVRERLAYHVRTGLHDLSLYDWHQYLSYADALWPRHPPR